MKLNQFNLIFFISIYRLSKIDTLRLAIAYIALLKELLDCDYDPFTYIEKCLKGEIKNQGTSEWNTSGKHQANQFFDI